MRADRKGQMDALPQGHVLKAYVEIDPTIRCCGRICLFLEDSGWIEFTGVTLNEDGFVLPEPLGCECIVIDISDRHWSLADYEVVFRSSYSKEGVFYAKRVEKIPSI